MIFEWDDVKAAKNTEKHGVTFEAAADIFFDEKRLILNDDRFDYGENRFITMGHIKGRLHVVIYTELDDTIRIISARKANGREQKSYGNYQKNH